MNFRNKYLLTTVRVLTGLLFAFSGGAGLMAGSSTEGVPPALVPVMQMLWASGLLPMIKVTELVSGLMLVSGLFPSLAAIFLAPICVGVLVFNSRLMPSFAPVGVVLCALDAYLGYAFWDKYKALFKRP